MKKFKKIVIYVLVIFIIPCAMLWGSIKYVRDYKKTICDTSISLDEGYTLTLLAIGEPEWPFGSADGRLILENENEKISTVDFVLRNDGGMINSNCWNVTWYDEFVEVIISGKEQSDLQIILYFNGEVEREQLSE